MTSPLAVLPAPHPAWGQNTSASLLSNLSRAARNGVGRSRAARNALHRHKQLLYSLPEDVRTSYAKHRDAEDLPRAFSLRFTDPLVDENNPELRKLNGQTIIFGRHGTNETGIFLNGHRVQPDDVRFVPATKSYSFTTDFAPEPGVSRTDVGAFISFEAARPTGMVTFGTRAFNVELDPKKVWFDVSVSADAGAYYSTGDRKLKWNPNSEEWQNASWETDNFTFGYDVKNVGDELQPQWVAENTFVDSSATPPVQFEPQLGEYTCIIGPDTDEGPLMVTDVSSKLPAAPAARKDKPVKSVFSRHWEVRFTPFGDQFTGAYQDKDGHVYAVCGALKLEDDVSMFSLLSGPSAKLPVEDLYAMTAGSEESINTAADTSTTPQLKVYELLNLNPMVEDSNDPSGYRDSVAQVAMSDFHDLIVYFMDGDLRETFVQKTVPDLPPHVLGIAHDDSAANNNENKSFYQKLQVPFIVSMLAQGTMENADQCNGARANAQLKDIPAHDDVYKRHSAKLYRARFIEKFPSIAKFLNDQKQNPQTALMEKFSAKMKSTITDKSKDMKDQNTDYEKNLKSTLADIDQLIDWAKERSLHWALELLYYVQKSALPNWFAQYTSGSSSSTLGMNLKQLNALFGILEDNAVNSKPNGRNFMQAFNEDMRLFQMTSVLPHLVDIDGNSREFDTLFRQCLDEYIKHYKGSPDQEHVEAVKAARKLYYDAEMRQKFWLPLTNAQRSFEAWGSWVLMVEKWENEVTNSKWFKYTSGAAKLFETFQAIFGVAIIIAGLIPDFRKQMTEEQKVQWAFCMASLSGLLVVKFAQGVVRFATLGKDIAGFGNSLKCLLGFESVIDAIPNAASRFEGSFAKFFTRTSKQTLSIVEEDILKLEMLESEEYSSFSTVERILGRNMGEVLGVVFGLTLAIVATVLSAIDLANETSSLLIAMDILVILSSVIQILAIAAGWIVAAGATAAAGTIFATLASYSAISLCATWGGPVAFTFAVVGIIVFIVYLSLSDHRSPIEKFLDDKAAPAGLRMRGAKQAPEYFNVVPAKGDNSSLVGLSIKGPLMSVKDYQAYPPEGSAFFGSPPPPTRYERLRIDSSNQQFISIDNAAKTPNLVDAVDYSLNTVWSLETQSDGKSLIYTAALSKGTPDADGFAPTVRTLWYLATSDDDAKVQFREMPKKDDDEATKDNKTPGKGNDKPTKYDKFLQHALWTVDVVDKPITDKPDMRDEKGNIVEVGHVLSAAVSISQDKLHLGLWVERKGEKSKIIDGVAVAKEGDAVSGGSSAFPDHMFCTGWVMSLSPIGPSEFSYAYPEWKLYEYDTDMRNIPLFLNPEVFSGGLKWSITPALNADCFELVTAAGEDEGMVRQKKGKKPKRMAKTEYTVSCSLLVSGQEVGTRSAKFSMEVMTATKNDQGIWSSRVAGMSPSRGFEGSS